MILEKHVSDHQSRTSLKYCIFSKQTGVHHSTLRMLRVENTMVISFLSTGHPNQFTPRSDRAMQREFGKELKSSILDNTGLR